MVNVRLISVERDEVGARVHFVSEDEGSLGVVIVTPEGVIADLYDRGSGHNIDSFGITFDEMLARQDEL